MPPAVFKTVCGALLRRPGWVRFPSIPAKVSLDDSQDDSHSSEPLHASPDDLGQVSAGLARTSVDSSHALVVAVAVIPLTPPSPSDSRARGWFRHDCSQQDSTKEVFGRSRVRHDITCFLEQSCHHGRAKLHQKSSVPLRKAITEPTKEVGRQEEGLSARQERRDGGGACHFVRCDTQRLEARDSQSLLVSKAAVDRWAADPCPLGDHAERRFGQAATSDTAQSRSNDCVVQRRIARATHACHPCTRELDYSSDLEFMFASGAPTPAPSRAYEWAFTRPSNGIGSIQVAYSRPPRSGPEKDLLHLFLGALPFHAHAGLMTTLFVEPALESGRPDLVVVIWERSLFENLTAAVLTSRELRLVHHLSVVGTRSLSDLTQDLPWLGPSAVANLVATGFVTIRNGVVRIRPLDEIFGVRALIAVEAKIRDWRQVLVQSRVNRWFASESYVLIPTPTPSLLAVAKDYGVGVLSVSNVGVKLHSPMAAVSGLPTSYGSWVFNEHVRNLTVGPGGRSASTRSDVALEYVSRAY